MSRRGLSCVLLAALVLTACTGAGSGRSRAAHIHARGHVTSPTPRPAPTPNPTPTPQASQLSIASSGLGISLSPDACIEEAPTAGDRHQVVFVDAGHGGVDPGSQGMTPDGGVVYEKDITLAVALILAQLLRARGFTVVMSRTQDSLVAQEPQQDLNPDGTLTPDGVRADLEARIACANSAQAAALVAVFANGFDDPSAVGGTFFYDPDRPFAQKSFELAQDVESGVMGQYQSHGWDIPDRGVEPDTADNAPALTPEDAAYGHLIELGPVSPGVVTVASNMPGTVVEPLFLTNPEEAAVAASPAGQQAIAAGFQQGVALFLGG